MWVYAKELTWPWLNYVECSKHACHAMSTHANNKPGGQWGWEGRWFKKGIAEQSNCL